MPRQWRIKRAPLVADAPRPSPHGDLVVLEPSAIDLRDPLGRRSPIPAGGNRPMSGVWDRDEAAIFVETVFGKHQGEIYAYLLRMMRDPEMAADMTQDTFIKAYKNYDTLEKPENARAWLYQIAHRVALDEIRRRKIVRFLPWTGESRGSVPSAEHLVMDARLSGDLQRALERIPERQRAALLLAELHDLTGLELAAALGVSHVAARALLTRARESLRQALAAEREADALAEAAREAGRDEGRDHGPAAEADR
jgi:RNA polymerase sigma-70 factor, ECF subfamily